MAKIAALNKFLRIYYAIEHIGVTGLAKDDLLDRLLHVLERTLDIDADKMDANDLPLAILDRFVFGHVVATKGDRALRWGLPLGDQDLRRMLPRAVQSPGYRLPS